MSAERERKDLSLRVLADLAGVDYHLACRVLRGRYRDAKALEKLEKAALNAPMPREEAGV